MIRLTTITWLIACFAAPAEATDLNLGAVPKYFGALRSAGQFNGSVLVARGDKILMTLPEGYADLEARTPLTNGSIFRIGSLTKPVTASAILMTVDDGVLKLDTKLCSIIDYCLPSWQAVTIEHLLSHTSGIRDHFNDLNAVPVAQTEVELKRALAALDRGEPLKSTPGATYAYSNFNYVLLGIVLEHVRKLGWREVIRDSVARRSSASTLDYDAVFDILPSRARGYDRTSSGPLRNIIYKDHAAYAAGGLRSTIGDFFRWSRASLQARLFSKGLRDRMVTPRLGHYGLGWQVTKFHGRTVYDHTGGVDGFSTHIAYYPDQNVTILVFTNVESDSAIAFACDAAALLMGVWKFTPRSVDEVRKLTPAQRCGIQQG